VEFFGKIPEGFGSGLKYLELMIGKYSIDFLAVSDLSHHMQVAKVGKRIRFGEVGLHPSEGADHLRLTEAVQGLAEHSVRL
jgi:hypothetical protein